MAENQPTAAHHQHYQHHNPLQQQTSQPRQPTSQSSQSETLNQGQNSNSGRSFNIYTNKLFQSHGFSNSESPADGTVQVLDGRAGSASEVAPSAGQNQVPTHSPPANLSPPGSAGTPPTDDQNTPDSGVAINSNRTLQQTQSDPPGGQQPDGLKRSDFIYLTEPGERETWDKKIEFLLAVIGFAVDLGNVWRFPYVCYRNGGGAFLIPYLVMLIFGGYPLFYLELALGQYHKSGCLTIWKQICPFMKGIGYAICFIDLYMGMYYNTIIAWAVYYLFASFTSKLPWTDCQNEWNTPNCRTLYERRSPNPLFNNYNASSYSSSSTSSIPIVHEYHEGGIPFPQSLNMTDDSNSSSPAQEYFERSVLEIQNSGGIEALGAIKPTLSMCLFAVFLLVYFSLWKGVKSAGKAVWITATMPYVVLFILLFRGITLPGSMDGIRYYLYPQWEKLLELSVWVDAATQIFFSLGPGFGTLLALSSYNKFHNNCYRDAILTSSINCLTSFLAGFVIFSVLGYMAKMQNKDVANVAADGPGLVFVVYPEAIATMHGSTFWSIIFFFMIITIGLDSTFGGLEAMITGLCDEYPNLLRKNREIFVGVLIMFIYLCALPTTTYGGNYVVTLLDSYGTSMALLFVVLVEAIAVCWIYGASKVSGEIREMLGVEPGCFWKTCWTFISPIFLFFIFVAALFRESFRYRELELGSYKYPQWSIYIGWALTLSSILCVPIYWIYYCLRKLYRHYRSLPRI